MRFWPGVGVIPGVGPVAHGSIEGGYLVRVPWFLPGALIAGGSFRLLENWWKGTDDSGGSGWSAITLIPTLGVRTAHVFSTVGASLRLLHSDQLPGAERRFGFLSPGATASIGAVGDTFGFRLEGEVQRHFLIKGSPFTLATLGVSMVLQLRDQ
jgi:hypothetical protein